MLLKRYNIQNIFSNLKQIIRNAVPTTILYDEPEYLEVMRLCRLNEDLRNQEFIEMWWRRKLANVLSDAIRFVPYYRRVAFIDPESISEYNSEEVLKTFPYLNKKIVMKEPENFIDSRFDKRKLIFGSSSGSTGHGIKLWKSRKESFIEGAFINYEWGKLGYIPRRSRVVRIAYEGRQKANEVPWRRLANRLLVSPYHLNSEWLGHIYEAIISFQPHFFHAYPSCMYELAYYISSSRLPSIECKGILLASEKLTSYQCKVIQENVRGPIIVNYGLSERSNLGFSDIISDPSNIAYRLNRLYSYSENKIDDFGNHEIVGTSFWSACMPLIRYQTEDYGLIENGIIKNLIGRQQEFLIAKNETRISTVPIEIDSFIWDFISKYQIVQDEIGKITVKIIPKKELDEQVRNLILRAFSKKWEDFFDVCLNIVNDLEKSSSGKTMLVVNHLHKI